MAKWIIEAGPEPGDRKVIKDGVDITDEMVSITVYADRNEVQVTVEYVDAAVTVLADDDPEPPDYCYECDRVIEGASDHAADCLNSDQPGTEPDHEQIIEDRAADRGRDPEAIMWGGEDVPS